MTFGRITVILGAIVAALIAYIIIYPEMRWILPVAASAESQAIDNLFRLMMVVSIGIFVFVQGFLLYFVWLYRRKPEDDEHAVGRALHGDNRLEIAWTAAPAIFLVVLTILSLNAFEELDLDGTREGATVVDVVGQQFFWNFTYPEAGITEVGTLTLQKDVPVTLNITANDVIHSFWVPEFRIKQDATPGFIRTINIVPTLEGEFELRCAEFCGAGHSAMLARVQVLNEADYQAWQEEKLSASGPGADASPEELAAFGQELYSAQGCGACHALEAVGAAGAVGPTHEGLAATAEERIADPAYTGEATTAEEYIAESIRNPGIYVVEGFANAMPPYGEDKFDDASLNALVQFLMQAD